MKTIGHFRICSIESTAPIVPPSRTKTGSLPKANLMERFAASTQGPLVIPL